MDLYVFDKELKMVGVVDSFISLIWVRRSSSSGSFELYVPATEKYQKMLVSQRYILRSDCDEAVYINSVIEKWDEDNGRCIIVSGYSLEGLLSKVRIAEWKKAALYTPKAALNAAMERCAALTANWINGFPDAEIYPSGMNAWAPDGMTVEQYVRLFYSYWKDWEPFHFSARIDRAERKIVFEKVQAVDRSKTVIFSADFDNLKNEMYEYSEEGVVNAVFVKSTLPDSAYTDTASTYNRTFAQMPTYYLDKSDGANKVEAYVEVEGIFNKGATVEGVTSYILDSTQTQYAMEWAAVNAISPASENISGEIIAEGYRKKFNVGDLVTVKNSVRDITMQKPIEEVTETFDASGKAVTAVLGVPLKTIYDLIKE